MPPCDTQRNDDRCRHNVCSLYNHLYFSGELQYSFDDGLYTLRAQRLHTSHHHHHQAYLVHGGFHCHIRTVSFKGKVVKNTNTSVGLHHNDHCPKNMTIVSYKSTTSRLHVWPLTCHTCYRRNSTFHYSNA